MDNVKFIRQFLTENDSIRRLVLKDYPNETIKIPPPYLGFKEKYENTIPMRCFECFSFKYFKTWEVRVYKDFTHEDHPNVFEIFDPGSVTRYKYVAVITDDENIFKECEEPYSCNNDDELEMAKDIVAYIKAGVQQYYHKKEENNNGNG